jgi:hypothetical protein
MSLPPPPSIDNGQSQTEAGPADDNPKPKRGAPFGNRNHLKHGLYSRAFDRSDFEDLAQPVKGQFEDEITLLRVLIARAAEQVKPSHARRRSFQQNLNALHTVSLAIARLNSFYRARLRHPADPEDDAQVREVFHKMGYTDERIQTEILGQPAVNRKPGGQSGNINALKHGFYASVFQPDELRRLEVSEQHEIEEELLLLRLLIKRTVASLPVGKSAEAQNMDYFKALRVLTFATSCLEQLQRTQLWMGGGQSLLRQKFNQVFWQAVEEFRKERDLFYDELPGFRPIYTPQSPTPPDVGASEPHLGWPPPESSDRSP